MGSIEISVVLPAWREWENLLTLVPALLAQPCVSEVIVVDDDSPGFEPAAWKAFLASGRVTLLRNDTRLGLAPSILRGARAARFSHLLIRDSDWNHSLDAVQALAEAAGAGAELAVASRYRSRGLEVTRLNDLFSALLNLFLRPLDARITDWTYGYHLLERDLLDSLPLDWIFRGRGEYTVRLYRALLAARPDLRVAEVVTRREARGAGRSTTSLLRHGVRYCAALFGRVPGESNAGKLERAVARWAGRGGSYAGSGHSFLGARARQRLFGASGAIQEPVLDLGCGNGAFTFSVLDRSLVVDGVDAGEAPITMARAFPYRALRQADLREPSFPGAGYRTFLCLETAQYLSWPALGGTFRAARRHAAGNATFLCLMPNRASHAHRLRRLLGLGAEDYVTHADAALVVAAAAGEGWRLDSLAGAAYGGTRVSPQSAHAPSPWAAHLLFRFSLSH